MHKQLVATENQRESYLCGYHFATVGNTKCNKCGFVIAKVLVFCYVYRYRKKEEEERRYEKVVDIPHHSNCMEESMEC